jgi:hypothetical protein
LYISFIPITRWRARRVILGPRRATRLFDKLKLDWSVDEKKERKATMLLSCR